MKKRCTNSSCRREFTVDADGQCPHCGKQYPQLAAEMQRGAMYDVILLKASDRMLATIKVLRANLGISLWDGIQLAKSAPCRVLSRVSYWEADSLAAQLRECGARAKIQRAGRR